MFGRVWGTLKSNARRSRSRSQGWGHEHMDLFQIVVITFVAVASITVAAGFVAMLVGTEQHDPRGRKNFRIAPGWYPDAQDESLLRYFDGRVPTHRTARRELT